MKRILTILFVLVNSVIYSQATLTDLNLVFDISESNSYSSPFVVKGTVLHSTSEYNGNDINVGDLVYFQDGTTTYSLPIITIDSQSYSYVELQLIDISSTVSYVPTGRAALIRTSNPDLLPVPPDGIPSDLEAGILNDLRLKIQNGVTAAEEITDYAGGVIASPMVPPAVSPSSYTGKTWRNSMGVLYRSDGVAWTPIGGAAFDTLYTDATNQVLVLQGPNDSLSTPIIDIAPVQSITAGTGISVVPYPGGVFNISSTVTSKIDTFGVYGPNLLVSLLNDAEPAKSVAASSILSAAGGLTGSGAAYRFGYFNSASNIVGSPSLVARADGTRIGFGFYEDNNALTISSIGTTSSTWALKVYSPSYQTLGGFRDDGSFQVGVNQIEAYAAGDFRVRNSTQDNYVRFQATGTNPEINGMTFLGAAKTMYIQNNAGSVNFGPVTTNQAKVHIRGTDNLSTSLALKVQGSTDNNALVVLNNGNIGIGRNDPTYKVDILGGLRLGTSTVQFGFGESGGNSIFLGSLTNHAFKFLVNTNEVARFHTSQRVSIGSTSDGTAKLFVVGESSGAGNYTVRFQNSLGEDGMILRNDRALILGGYPNTLNSAGSPVNILSTSSTGVLESHTAAELVTAGGASTGVGVLNRVPIYSSTNTFTTQPYYAITYSDADAISQSIGSYSYYGQIPAFVAPYMGQNAMVTDATGAVRVQNAGLAPSMIALTDGGGLSYYASPTNVATNTNIFTNSYLKWRVLKNGDMGVGGVVTPSARLHVIGSGNNSTTWTAQFHNNATNNALMIRDDGNIGIGTASPSYKISLYNATNSANGLHTENVDLGTAAQSILTARVGAGALITMGIPGAGFTNTGLMNAYRGYIRSTGSSGMLIASDNSSGAIILATEGTATTNEKLRIDATAIKSTVNFYAPKGTAFRGGGNGTGAGMSFWGTEDSGTGWGGFMGRNMKYDGTNYKYVSTNASNLWGTVSGLWVEGTGGIAMKFIARPATEQGTEFISTTTDRNNYTRLAIAYNGNVGLSTINPLQTLHVQGTARITGSDGTATTIMGRDADGDVSVLELGSGLSITSGVLNVSATGATNLAVTGTSSPLTLTSDTGTDVTFTAGTNVTLTGTSGNITINATGGISGTPVADMVPYWNTGATALVTGGIKKETDNLTLENGLGLKLVSTGAGNMIINATTTEGVIQTYGSIPLKINPLGNGIYLGGLTGGANKVLGIASDGLVSVTDLSNAGGDVTGPFSNLQIGANAVGTTEIADNSVSANKIGAAQVTMAKINQSSATTGQAIIWNGSAWAPANITTGVTSLNGQTGATQTFFASSTGTDFAITSSGNVHTFVLPTANGTQTGKLTSSDWTTFSNKIGGSGTTDQLAIFTGSGTISSSSSLSYSASTLTVAGDISPTGKLKAGTLGTVPTVMVGRNASNELSTVVVGGGLSFNTGTGTLSATTLYNADGSLPGSRTVTMSNYNLLFDGSTSPTNNANTLSVKGIATGGNTYYPLIFQNESSADKLSFKVGTSEVSMLTGTENLKLGTGSQQWKLNNVGSMTMPALASNPSTDNSSMWVNSTTNRLMVKTPDGNVKAVATLQDDLAGTNTIWNASTTIGGTSYGNEVGNSLSADAVFTLGGSLTEGRQYILHSSNASGTWFAAWDVASGYTVKWKGYPGNITSADGPVGLAHGAQITIIRFGTTIYVN